MIWILICCLQQKSGNIWHKTFTNFLAECGSKAPDKYSVTEQTLGFSNRPPASVKEQTLRGPVPEDDAPLAGTFTAKRCYFCGNSIHNRRNCPVRNCVCDKCGKKGHYAKVCRLKAPTVGSLFSPSLCVTVASCPNSLKQASVKVSVGKKTLTALVDSGSSNSYISERVAKHLDLVTHTSTQDVSMALNSLKSHIGYYYVDITLNENVYPSCRLGILKDLCSDIILGQDFQKRKHKSVIIKYGGFKPEFDSCLCSFRCTVGRAVSFFANLRPDCKPIATKSRRFSKEDQDFIQQEINQRLLEEIIEPSNSPWRAQVVVVKD